MVKFSKQFEGQLVPEWKEAFVDYSQLKKDFKKMQVLGAKEEILNKPQLPLAQWLLSPFWKLPLFGVYAHKEHGVNKKLESSASKGNWYETELPDLFADTDAARDFFLRFDHQLNKVNQFYKGKEREFLEREECLRKQMDIFIKFKDALKQKKEHISSVNDSKDNPYISFTFRRDDESNSGRSSQFEQNEELQICDSFKRTGCSEKVSNDKIVGQEGNSRSLLNINISLTAPSRTFSSLNYQVWGDMVNQSNESGPEGRELSINKTKLHHAEKMIRGAYIELFKGLGYLQTYRNLNMLAFVKILKKCDKVTEKRILPKYLKVAESSYFNCSDKAIKLKYEVEELFVKRFAHNDKRKAMRYLKSRQRKESHATTFFVGFFMGCFAALFVGYCIMAHITGLYSDQSDNIYMETVYPVLSMFSLFFLHLFLYGCNIFMWRKTRINYSFIFGFDPTKELKYWDVFLICNTSMTVVVGVIFAHLTITAKGYGYVQAQAIPGLLTLMFLLVLICPFNIVYRSSRYHFLRVIRNIILSPFYKVVMVDFFMADQLCSQVPMLRNMESVACYYITQSYKTQDYGFCMRSGHYKDLPYTVAFLPYYWRAMQCARRWFDERETIHLLNLGKYVSAMLAAGAMVAYKKERTIGCLYFVVAMSSMTTVYQLYWDFVKDCGLLQSNSRNPWLRNELVLRRKFIYYLSMGLNLILRLAWLQTVIHYNFGSLDYRVTSFFFAALELIRRGHWNFYRLENEHLNNVGKFRIIKTVPLPFHEVDQD